MLKKVFFSFHYDKDHWRAAQVRNIGAVEGNKPVNDNDWESIKANGDLAITNWINGQLKYKSCTVVLIGEKTSDRKWIKYEIEKTWNDGKGLVGIYIHGLKDQYGQLAYPGKNPFDNFKLGDYKLSNVVKCYNPSGNTSTMRYGWISRYLADAVEEAIYIRNKYLNG